MPSSPPGHRRTRLRRLAASVAASLVAVTVVATPVTAEAATKKAKAPHTYCKGFTACEKKGYTTHGYKKVYKQVFWDAAPGHNCTNYIAYRLNSGGRLTDRASKIGNASEWGINIPKDTIATVHSTPKVGDVAWWSHHRKSPIKSHVAYVERVFKDGSITISHDNYGGDFYWSRYYKGHKQFPSAFLRFKKSNGSPAGKTTGVTTSSARRVRIDAFHAEADHRVGAVGLISWGAPRGSAAAITQTTVSFNGDWWAARTFPAGKIPKVAYVYALNTPGTKGADRLLGKVSIPGGTVPEPAGK